VYRGDDRHGPSAVFYPTLKTQDFLSTAPPISQLPTKWNISKLVTFNHEGKNQTNIENITVLFQFISIVDKSKCFNRTV
jgi:hypothetical protein